MPGLKVMLYAGAEAPGGLIAHVELLAAGLAAGGHEVRAVLSPSAAVDPAAGACGAAGAAVTRLTVHGKRDVAGMMGLRALVARERPDIFHLHLSSPIEAVPALMAARLGGARRIVTTEHAPTWYPLERPWSGAAKKAATRMLDAVIAVCDADAAFLERRFGVPRGLMTVIHNGVAGFGAMPPRDGARAALGLGPEAACVAGFVGALEAKKGVVDLVEGASRSGIPGLALVLAGDGGLVADLSRRAASLPFRLVIPGRVRDVAGLLAALDLFVFPSHQEALPLALLEAMSAGLPIIASRVGGIPEAIEDGASGILVPPSEPEAIAGALRNLSSDPVLARRLGAAAREASSRFTADRMVRRIETLYHKAIAGASGTPT